MAPTTQLRRAVASSFLGSVIEYYDFLLYATASAVVFNKVFFSSLDPLVGTIASFGTFATGYLARPLGGILFGHYGDLLGRKKMLVLSMSLMGVASFLIGVLPTYSQVGWLAPAGLILLRVLQGISVGGEWGGAVLMSAEHATSRRGLWASFTNAGAPCGMVLSTAALTGTAALVGEQAFLDWGWRVPFLLSVVLLGIGLFVRMKVEETPVFKAERKPGSMPLLDILRNHPRTLALGIGVGLSAFVAQSTLTTFVLAYGVQAGNSRQLILNALTLSSALAVIGIIGWSAMSDKVGRRPVVLVGAVLMAAFGFVLFPMVDNGFIVIALVLGQAVIHPMMYGPLAALYSELFNTGSRYTGASLGYQFAGLGAGLAPLLFAQVQKTSGTGAIPFILAAFCLLTVICTVTLHETSRTSLTGDRNAERGTGQLATPPSTHGTQA
ncbi:Predicted arabinose efflux permease, MFS family [Lentzea albidocapillata subsp. violacea]|uniref:Predicted arabinose efflux permease, MFS family n=1 Tax=Lentzea albidocapillata subsp. violacea TaxID=128104 RepID=A0A1G8QXF3_9PSEU|nr:MFS transporter [Lentzea albidocapillata]SDJ08840.1 Predicted arabinose efflux permease, MFS family [Lentzea albidocapillata subsp. violacea]